jgi:recombinational DNA repair protein (RecF pathway)
MYKTYTTDALVCGSKSSFTSDKSYLLFTRDAGMLWATARSVRVEKSKQRYALQDFSVIRVSLVKGKGGWRIGSVQALNNPFMEANARHSRTGVATIVKLLRRFLQGEEPHLSIYKDTSAALARMTEADAQACTDLEDQFTLRTLHALGYIAPHDTYTAHLESENPWEDPQEVSVQAKRAIEQALSVSHL